MEPSYDRKNQKCTYFQKGALFKVHFFLQLYLTVLYELLPFWLKPRKIRIHGLNVLLGNLVIAIHMGKNIYGSVDPFLLQNW